MALANPMTAGGGAGMVPLIMIGGAAGVVVGVMNATGLGQSVSFVLVQAGVAGVAGACCPCC